MLEKSIIIKSEFIGFHAWPKAPKQVEFLRNRHRHLFKVEIEIDVFHSDRELEFFMVQSFLNKILLKLAKKDYSCEMYATKIFKPLAIKYGYNRNYIVTVSEDGENAGRVKYKGRSNLS